MVKEFRKDQLPLFLGTLIVAIFAVYLQLGSFPSGSKPFPVAKVSVPIWHLVLMGFGTGYLMGLVGEASGLLSLPYSISILNFDNIAVSPTSLITTFINPFGALLGYWRGNQWNIDFAKWFCIGALIGSPVGPFFRYYFLEDSEIFKMIIGFLLVFVSIHLWIQITPWYIKRIKRHKLFNEKVNNLTSQNIFAKKIFGNIPENFKITTIEKSWKFIKIEYCGEQKRLNVPIMLFIGFLVAIISSAFGVGGGFMLVPILIMLFDIPIYVLVAATVPYVIILSGFGIISYVITMPLLTGIIINPDWGFGLFVASGAIIGSWAASKSQRYISEKYLKPVLGLITGTGGLIYILNYFWKLPIKI